jgi:RNA polymerase sigma-70 factor (ECF subfamily)
MNVDPATFETVVNTFYKPLYRFALSLARCEPTACDLTQETFRRFASKGHQLRDASKVKTWLFTTLYREFLRSDAEEDRMRSLKMTEFEETSGDAPACENAIDGRAARDALLQLEEHFRAPLALFYLQEHSYEEIAEILEVPMGTVMSRIARGRDLLRQRLRGPAKKPGHPLLVMSL